MILPASWWKPPIPNGVVGITQPLQTDLAPILSAWLRDKPARKLLWPGGWVNHAAKLVRADLAAARTAWIETATTTQERQDREESSVLAYRDERGRVFDFHSLRHQYISNLVAAGVHPKIAQTLARHSTMALTMDRYTHTKLVDLAGSVNSLPTVHFVAPTKETEALKATGTENWNSSEVPAMVPRGAENGAVLPAPKTLRIASNCTDEEIKGIGGDATTPQPGTTNGNGLHADAPVCTNMHCKKRRGPSRIRTGDGGFAIRCLIAIKTYPIRILRKAPRNPWPIPWPAKSKKTQI